MKFFSEKSKLQGTRWRMAAARRGFFSVFSPILFFLGFSASCYANNLSIANVSLTSPSSANGTIQVQCDISWSNSWRNQTNYDAAWIFVKYSTDSGTTWNHATLKTSGTNPSGFSTGSGTAIEIKVPTDKKGAFIERSSPGYGALATTSVQLVWDYTTDGLTASSTARVEVFGVEMVYIPQAAFSAGDTSATDTFKRGSSDTTPWPISSEGAISVTNASSGGYYYTTGGWSGESSTGSSFSIPAAFPKGYAAFYIMKYEITEGEWVDFFNTLTAAQKTTRDVTSATGKNSDAVVNRNTIAWSSGNATTTRTDRACSWLSWSDMCAYADWAALRPMTELEFEKVCRGPNAAVSGEYAWGSTSITAAATISGTEDGTETITTSGANSNEGNTTFSGGDASTGALRAGIFATSTSTRVNAGAGYYGAMEMSGNLFEHCVTVGNATGLAFTATNGDGVLTSTSSYEGNATNTDWPGIDATTSRGVTGSTGSGFRGGSWTSSSYLQTSDRFFAADPISGRANNYGGRAARTAP